MTRNQLQYHANMEAARHNRVSEEQADVSNLIRRDEVTEASRSHRAQETETNRHNIVNEKQAAATLKEQSRHNVHTEVAGYMSATGTLMRGAGSLIDSGSKVVGNIVKNKSNTGRIGF